MEKVLGNLIAFLFAIWFLIIFLATPLLGIGNFIEFITFATLTAFLLIFLNKKSFFRKNRFRVIGCGVFFLSFSVFLGYRYQMLQGLALTLEQGFAIAFSMLLGVANLLLAPEPYSSGKKEA